MTDLSSLIETADLRLLLTTVPTETEALYLALAAVEKGLAAEVLITPVTRVRRENGKLVVEDVYRLSFKTTRERLDALVAWLQRRHPLALPECLVLTPIASSVAYRDWLRSSLQGGSHHWGGHHHHHH
uniref:T33-ml35-redesigned-CutA-fold n=1 Tax=synthetic construct TaxID=32630 RepID=UPI0029908372|nr:Chain B, T33-ml35-redesigned-CutA-fold [synthetic construct]